MIPWGEWARMLGYLLAALVAAVTGALAGLPWHPTYTLIAVFQALGLRRVWVVGKRNPESALPAKNKEME